MTTLRRAAGLGLLLGLLALLLCTSSCTTPSMRGCPGTHCGCNTPSDCYCNDATTRCEWDTCDDACLGRCNRDSECIFEVGPQSTLICDRASCSFTVGDGSNVSCINGGSCRVQCTAGCEVDCSAAGPCFLACAGETVAKAIRGTGRCDAE